MAVSPNTTCGSFCTWVLATAWLKATATQNVLVTTVQTAANASATVSDHTWNEFLRITGTWFRYYQSYILQTTQYATLPSGIIQGDTLYGSAANVLTSLAKSTTANSFLKNSGTNNNPQWVVPATSDLYDNVVITDYSSSLSVTGFSGALTYKYFIYQKIGKFLHISWELYGTGSGTTTTMTLPSSYTLYTPMRKFYAVNVSVNNGVNSMGLATILSNSSTVNFYWDIAQSNWTNATPRLCSGFAVIPIN